MFSSEMKLETFNNITVKIARFVVNIYVSNKPKKCTDFNKYKTPK